LSGPPATPTAEKKPAASTSAVKVREKINDMVRENLPQLTKAYNEALQKEAGKPSMKKEPQKETQANETETKATARRA